MARKVTTEKKYPLKQMSKEYEKQSDSPAPEGRLLKIKINAIDRLIPLGVFKLLTCLCSGLRKRDVMKNSAVASGLYGKEQRLIIDVCPGYNSGEHGSTHYMHLSWHLSEYVSFPFTFNVRLTECKSAFWRGCLP